MHRVAQQGLLFENDSRQKSSKKEVHKAFFFLMYRFKANLLKKLNNIYRLVLGPFKYRQDTGNNCQKYVGMRHDGMGLYQKCEIGVPSY